MVKLRIHPGTTSCLSSNMLPHHLTLMHPFLSHTPRILATCLALMTPPLLTSCAGPSLANFLKNYDLEAGATCTTPSGSSVNGCVKLRRTRSGKEVVTSLPNLPGIELHVPVPPDGADAPQIIDPVHGPNFGVPVNPSK